MIAILTIVPYCTRYTLTARLFWFPSYVFSVTRRKSMIYIKAYFGALLTFSAMDAIWLGSIATDFILGNSAHSYEMNPTGLPQ